MADVAVAVERVYRGWLWWLISVFAWFPSFLKIRRSALGFLWLYNMWLLMQSLTFHSLTLVQVRISIAQWNLCSILTQILSAGPQIITHGRMT